MDFELIENLSNEQVSELYTDVIDGSENDKLSEFKCDVQLTNFVPSIYRDKDGNEISRDVTFHGDNYAFGTREDAVVLYLDYNGVFVYSSSPSAASTRVETYVKQRHAGTDNEFIGDGGVVTYTNVPKNNALTYLLGHQYVVCDSVELCTRYFNEEMLKIKHCNMTHALEYESGESDTREENGVLFTYAVYTNCNSLWDIKLYLQDAGSSLGNAYWHSNDVFHVYMQNSNFHLGPGNNNLQLAWGALFGSVLYNNYFEFAYYNNGIFEIVTETRKQHFRSAILNFTSGIYCKNMR